MLIAVGKIVAPHGVRGDVRVIPLTDFPERFSQFPLVWLADGSQLTISSSKSHKQFLLIKFRQLDGMDAIEHLRGQLIYVKRVDLIALPEGSYYIFDLIGLTVYDETNACLGVITEVLQTGSNDVYVVEQAGKKPLLIPGLKDVVREIDIPGRRMTVKLQEEWSE